MKTFALALTTTALAAITPVQAWWDNGHMLVGEVASQLMTKENRATIEKVLTTWEKDFPNTNTIATAAIWPDLIKCNKPSDFCKTELLPSFGGMDKWHYVNLPLFANGAKWGNGEPDLALFKASFGGDAPDVMEQILRTFNTTKSNWAANLGLRQLIHTLADVHQPMHAVGAISEKYPQGDQGGNLYKFAPPCAFTNLHAMYDSAGGDLVNYWNLTISFLPELQKNASELIESIPLVEDLVPMDAYTALPYESWSKAMVDNAILRKFILGSYSVATTFSYPSLDLNFDAAGFVPCPSSEYVFWVTTISKYRIALAGKRLAIVLTKIAEQLRVLGLA